MEIKDIRKFAAEVGLDDSAIAGKSDIEIAKMVVDAINPEKGYSQEFVKWYDKLDDSIFDQMDSTAEGTPASAEAVDEAVIEELITHINSLTKVQEFKEVLEDGDIEKIFSGLDTSKFKLAPQFKKAMIEHLSGLKNKPPEEVKKEPQVVATPPEPPTSVFGGLVAKCKTIDDLIVLIEKNPPELEGFDIGEEATELEQIKELIFKHLNYDPKKETPPSASVGVNKLEALKRGRGRPRGSGEATPAETEMVIAFDPTSFDPNDIYEKAVVLQIGALRKFYKQIMDIAPVEMPAKAGMNKESMLDTIATGLIAIAENGPKQAPAATTEQLANGAVCQLEITPATIKAAVDANDKDTLIAMCETSGVALNPLQKRSITAMAQLLNKNAPPAATPAAPSGGLKKFKLGLKKEEPSESYLVKAFKLIETMVLAKQEESAITEAVIPIFVEAGKKLLTAKVRIKTLVEIAMIEHGLKKK